MWNFTKFGKNSHFSTSVVWKNWNSSSCGEIPWIEIWNFSTWQISSPPTCRWSRWQIWGMDISNTNIYIQLTFIPQMLAKYIQFKYIILIMYIPQPCAQRAHRNPSTYIHPPCVGMIYPIPTYIFNWHIFPKLLVKICPIEIYYPAPEGRSETPQHTFLPQVLAWYVQCQYINTTGMYSSIKSEYKYKYYLIYIFYWIYFAYI